MSPGGDFSVFNYSQPVLSGVFMNMFYLNTQGLSGRKVSLIEAFLIDKNYDVLCINEHWILDSDRLHALNIEGFSLASEFCRSERIHGGTAIFVSNKHSCFRQLGLSRFSVERHFEVSGIELKGCQYIVIYRSPPPAGEFEIFCENLCRVLDGLNNKKSIIFSGDFNVHFGTADPEARVVEDIFCSYGLFRTVFGPTRGVSCLDNVFTNLDSHSYRSHILDYSFSDHKAISFTFKFKTEKPKMRRVNYRPLTEGGFIALYNIIDKSDWDFVRSEVLGPNEKLLMFMDIIVEACVVAFPERTRVVDTSRTHVFTVGWFDGKLRESREKLKLLTKLNRLNPTVVTNITLKSFRRFYRHQIDNAKKAANDRHINMFGNKNKAMWDVIKNNNPVKRDNMLGSISPAEFNNYFTGMAESIRGDLPETNIDPLGYFDGFGQNSMAEQLSFSFREITIIELRDTISRLGNSPSKDVYGLNTKIIKTLKNIIVLPLYRIINDCLRANVFPECLKTSRVVPVYKKGNRSEVDNYRPIAIIPIIGKIFESVLNSQIVEFFERSNLFSPAQFGFRPGMSTTLAVKRLVDHVQGCFEDKGYVQACFYDLTKAFDCVDHRLLLGKLGKYKFSRDSVEMIETYLHNRKQYVTINSDHSNYGTVKYGIPQGSILGPTLFLIFINDITFNSNLNLILYADDTTSINVSSDLERLGQQAGVCHMGVSQWFLSNRLKVNEKKSQTLNFSLRQIEANNRPVKFLGMHLDSGLTWEEHINNLISRLNRTLYVIRNLLRSVSGGVVMQAYYGLFHSRLSYGLLLWGHSAHASRVFGVQRKCVRLIAGLGYDAPCEGKFVELSILTLPSMYILECLIYIRRNLASYNRNNSYHQYETRQNNNLVIEHHRVARSRCGYNHHGVRYYNVLPEVVRNLAPTLFKNKLKAYFRSKAFFSTQEYLNNDFSDLIDGL